MDRFTTVSDNRKSSLKFMFFFWLVLAVLWCFALLISLRIFIIAQATLLLIMIISFFMSKKKTRWKLEFTGNRLRVTNLITMEEYDVWDVTADAFDLRQNKRQAKEDLGDFIVKNTLIIMGDVQNFSALKEYINTHF